MAAKPNTMLYHKKKNGNGTNHIGMNTEAIKLDRRISVMMQLLNKVSNVKKFSCK